MIDKINGQSEKLDKRGNNILQKWKPELFSGSAVGHPPLSVEVVRYVDGDGTAIEIQQVNVNELEPVDREVMTGWKILHDWMTGKEH